MKACHDCESEILDIEGEYHCWICHDTFCKGCFNFEDGLCLNCTDNYVFDLSYLPKGDDPYYDPYSLYLSSKSKMHSSEHFPDLVVFRVRGNDFLDLDILVISLYQISNNRSCL